MSYSVEDVRHHRSRRNLHSRERSDADSFSSSRKEDSDAAFKNELRRAVDKDNYEASKDDGNVRMVKHKLAKIGHHSWTFRLDPQLDEDSAQKDGFVERLRQLVTDVMAEKASGHRYRFQVLSSEDRDEEDRFRSDADSDRSERSGGRQLS